MLLNLTSPQDCTEDAITPASWILEMDQGVLDHLLLHLTPREESRRELHFTLTSCSTLMNRLRSIWEKWNSRVISRGLALDWWARGLALT